MKTVASSLQLIFPQRWLMQGILKHIYSDAIKSIQFFVLNTGSHVNGCVKIFLLSFYHTFGSAKHKFELFCSH